MDTFISLLPLFALALLFWLLVILPTRRRQKQTAQLQDSLQVGEEVMLTSGIFGTLRGVGEDRVVLEVSPGVEVEVARAAVATRTETAQASGAPTTNDEV